MMEIHQSRRFGDDVSHGIIEVVLLRKDGLLGDRQHNVTMVDKSLPFVVFARIMF